MLLVVFDVGGVLEGMTAGKGYIDMSTVDVETSQRISKVGMVLREGGIHSLLFTLYYSLQLQAYL